MHGWVEHAREDDVVTSCVVQGGHVIAQGLQGGQVVGQLEQSVGQSVGQVTGALVVLSTFPPFFRLTVAVKNISAVWLEFTVLTTVFVLLHNVE